MTGVLGSADFAAYLRATGWRPTGQIWRGADVWGRDDVEVLLPRRVDLQDHAVRLREALAIVADSEGRAEAELAVAVTRSVVDATTHQLEQPGPLPLAVGETVLGGLHAVLTSAARTVVEGQHLRFTGRQPAVVTSLVGRTTLGLDGSSFTLLVPTGPIGEGLRGRDVAVQMFDAVDAAAEAAATGEPAAFDSKVATGVSADLCAALGHLAGADHREPFSVGFDWAVAEPAPAAPRTIEFAAGAGAVARAAATRLRRLDVSGEAVVEGRVDGLHDEADSPDRRRVRVRGLLRTGEYERDGRALWVRLDGQREYDRMVQAYRSGNTVRTAGRLTSRDGRVELAVAAEGIEIESEDDSGE